MALHMSTIISRRSTDILAHISKIRPASPSHIPLFCVSVSPHTQADELHALVSRLSSLSIRGVGCLSACIPSSDPVMQHSIACSIAIFDCEHAVPFRSRLPARQAPQVGRWHAFRKRGEDVISELESENGADVNWDDVWSKKPARYSLPPEIQPLDPKTVDTIIYFSESGPEAFSNALHSMTSTTKVGLIASSTPFVTGRPFTLFHRNSIHSTGAVGVCLTSATRPRSYVEFPGLLKLTEPLRVTSSEGNLIHTLDDKNPSSLLLSAIQKKSEAAGQKPAPYMNMKDDQYYLGALRKVGNEQELHQLYTITSGDPSRGTIALEGDIAPTKGTLVQMYHLPAGVSPNSLARFQESRRMTPSKHYTLAFTVASSEQSHRSPCISIEEGSDPHKVVLEDTFLAASENGFIVDRRVRGSASEEGDRPWHCTIRGGVFGLEWDR